MRSNKLEFRLLQPLKSNKLEIHLLRNLKGKIKSSMLNIFYSFFLEFLTKEKVVTLIFNPYNVCLILICFKKILAVHINYELVPLI